MTTIQICRVCKKQIQAEGQAYCWHRKPVACRPIGYIGQGSAASRHHRKARGEARVEIRTAVLIEQLKRAVGV